MNAVQTGRPPSAGVAAKRRAYTRKHSLGASRHEASASFAACLRLLRLGCVPPWRTLACRGTGKRAHDTADNLSIGQLRCYLVMNAASRLISSIRAVVFMSAFRRLEHVALERVQSYTCADSAFSNKPRSHPAITPSDWAWAGYRL